MSTKIVLTLETRAYDETKCYTCRFLRDNKPLGKYAYQCTLFGHGINSKPDDYWPSRTEECLAAEAEFKAASK